MTDHEMIQLFKERPELRAFVRELGRIAHDDILLEAVKIMLDGFSQGMTEAEVKTQAAGFLREHGRPEAADRIMNT